MSHGTPHDRRRFERVITPVAAALVMLGVAGLGVAQDFAIGWYTIDGGTPVVSTGGGWTLTATIGQPDAGLHAGGDFDLFGGFWSAAPTCACLSDMNADGDRNGLDVQGFVACLTGGGTNCDCANVDVGAGLDLDDLTAFVDDLLDGASCN